MFKSYLRSLGMLCLSLILTTVVRAQGDVTASWDFENDLPAGIQSATNYQGVTADIPSTVEGIAMQPTASFTALAETMPSLTAAPSCRCP